MEKVSSRITFNYWKFGNMELDVGKFDRELHVEYFVRFLYLFPIWKKIFLYKDRYFLEEKFIALLPGTNSNVKADSPHKKRFQINKTKLSKGKESYWMQEKDKIIYRKNISIHLTALKITLE